MKALILAASGWLALAATHLPPASPVRIAVTLAFLLLCPGTAVVRILTATWTDRYEPMLAAALAVAASLALATLASEAFFLAGAFTLARCLAALAALTSVLAFVPALIGGRSRARRVSPASARPVS